MHLFMEFLSNTNDCDERANIRKRSDATDEAQFKRDRRDSSSSLVYTRSLENIRISAPPIASPVNHPSQFCRESASSGVQERRGKEARQIVVCRPCRFVATKIAT